MPDTITQDWKVGDPALIESWGPDGPTGRWYEGTIIKIDRTGGPFYYLRCNGFECIRFGRELKRPTPTEPATCHKVSRMVGIRVRVEPPNHVVDEGERSLVLWAADFHNFIIDHQGQRGVTVRIERGEQDQCSACGKGWRHIYRYDAGGLHCKYCNAKVDETEPTP